MPSLPRKKRQSNGYLCDNKIEGWGDFGVFLLGPR